MIYLYVKTHNVTGLKYFGKTEKKDPFVYLGSGKHWLRHIKKHGKDISTEIVATFQNREEASDWAIAFSLENNIIESNDWANLMLETVKDGVLGYIHTSENKALFSRMSKERWNDAKYRETMKEKHRKRLEDKEERQKCGNAFRGKKRPEHSTKLSGRKHSVETLQKMRKPKHPGHGNKVSASMKGISKSESHKQALSGPKPRVCRLTDKKEMSVNHFTRWVKANPLE